MTWKPGPQHEAEYPPLPPVMVHSIREALLIIPTTVDRGELENELTYTFGGFTQTEGLGRWVNGIESVYIYRVAVANCRASIDKLREIATLLRERGQQESVYLRLPDGEVEYV